jgi:hypothetical protein
VRLENVPISISSTTTGVGELQHQATAIPGMSENTEIGDSPVPANEQQVNAEKKAPLTENDAEKSTTPSVPENKKQEDAIRANETIEPPPFSPLTAARDSNNNETEIATDSSVASTLPHADEPPTARALPVDTMARAEKNDSMPTSSPRELDRNQHQQLQHEDNTQGLDSNPNIVAPSESKTEGSEGVLQATTPNTITTLADNDTNEQPTQEETFDSAPISPRETQSQIPTPKSTTTQSVPAPISVSNRNTCVTLNESLVKARYYGTAVQGRAYHVHLEINNEDVLSDLEFLGFYHLETTDKSKKTDEVGMI